MDMPLRTFASVLSKASGYSLTTIAVLLVSCDISNDVSDKATIEVPMRDGIELATDLYFPEAENPPYPAILIRTPYNKAMLEQYGRYYARAGFVVAIQDVRGRWASQGEWQPFVHEGDDGYDAVEWLAQQEWSDGKIGMSGASYSGTAQLLAATRKPPHLTTIVPVVAPAMPFENIPRDGGALMLGWALRWADIAENAKSGAEMQAKVTAGIMDDWSYRLSGLPVITLDEQVTGAAIPYFRDWAKNLPESPYWRTMRYLEALRSVDIPVFLQSGWFDPGVHGAISAFNELTAGNNPHVRLLIGPWVHGDQGSRYLNGMDMGAQAERDLMAEYRRWFEFWLQTDGDNAPTEPGVELFVMGANRWITGTQYPVQDTKEWKLFLHRKDGRGILSADTPPTKDECDEFVYDPGDATPSFHAALKRGTLDAYMSRIDSAGDVLVYESNRLENSLSIAGPIDIQLFASTSAVDTDWVATLYALDKHDRARVLGLTFGIQRARYRLSMTEPVFSIPGEVTSYQLPLGHTAAVLQSGEKLRIEIASAAFPEYSRNLNTGGHNELDTEWVTARQCVYRSEEHASHLVLKILEQ
jgi:putative CocE/NonD family hydrolase